MAGMQDPELASRPVEPARPRGPRPGEPADPRGKLLRRIAVFSVGIGIGLMVVGFANQRRQAARAPQPTVTDEADQSARLAERLQQLQEPTQDAEQDGAATETGN